MSPMVDIERADYCSLRIDPSDGVTQISGISRKNKKAFSHRIGELLKSMLIEGKLNVDPIDLLLRERKAHRMGYLTQRGRSIVVLHRRCKMTPRRWFFVGTGTVVLLVLALIGLFVWPGWAHGQTAPAEPTPYPAVQPTLTPYPTQEKPTEYPAPTQPPSVPATAALPTCTSLTVKSETPFDIQTNMDTGDAAGWVVTYGYDDTGSKFVAVIEAMWNLDFESTHIKGKYWLLDGDVASVICFAQEKAASTGTSDLLYVGTNDAPTGFTKEFVRGWKMTSSQPFNEVKVDTGAANWSDAFNRSKKDTDPIGDKAGVIYGQLWDGADSSKVTHFIVSMGYMVKFTGLQGTYWMVTGGDAKSVQDRFDQMTREVETRDDHPVVTKVFCGDSTPTGWSNTMPSGWTCQRIP